MTIYLNSAESKSLINLKGIQNSIMTSTTFPIEHILVNPSVNAMVLTKFFDQMVGICPNFKEEARSLLFDTHGTPKKFAYNQKENGFSVLDEMILQTPVDSKAFLSILNFKYAREIINDCNSIISKKIKALSSDEYLPTIVKMESILAEVDKEYPFNFLINYDTWKSLDAIKPNIFKKTQNVPKLLNIRSLESAFKKDYEIAAVVRVIGKYSIGSAKPLIEELVEPFKGNAKVTKAQDDVWIGWGLKEREKIEELNLNVDLFKSETNNVKYHYDVSIDPQKLMILTKTHGKKFDFILYMIAGSMADKYKQKQILNKEEIVFNAEHENIEFINGFKKEIQIVFSKNLTEFLLLHDFYKKRYEELDLKTLRDAFLPEINRIALHNNLKINLNEDTSPKKSHKI